MSWQAARAALDIDSINPTAKFVLVALCLRAGADGRAWPSVATIATDTGLGESTVRRALGQLHKEGQIALIHRPGRSSVMSVTPLAPSGVPCSLRDPTPLAASKNPARSERQKYKEEIKEVAEPASPALRSGSASNGNGRAPGAPVDKAVWVELADGTVKRAP